MYSFMNDYNEIAHENILNAIVKNNYVQTLGYGKDMFCDEAKELVKKRFDLPNTDVYFLMAGTQTNTTVLDHMLASFECVISTDTAHINVHEVTAIESSGHKIVTAPNKNGKLLPQDIEKICEVNIADEHMALPRVVYISNATEIGTIYTKQELQDIYDMCRKYDLYLYLDGARLGTAMMSRENDIDVKDLAKYCDVFYFSATKNGGLMGECVIINNDKLKPHFFRRVKARGALCAKSKVIGIVFTQLMKDDLYFNLAKHSSDMAFKIYDELKNTDIFYEKVQSNQIFMKLTNDEIERLSKKYVFSIDKKIDENTKCVRFVTSWATDEKQVDNLIDDIKKLK